MLTTLLAAIALALPMLTAPAESDLEARGQRSQRAIQFCRQYALGWLAYADPESGLLPRTVNGQQFWNAKDCAADNYPFIVLTADILGDVHLRRTARTMLEQETRLTSRVDSLPDDFLFQTQTWPNRQPSMDALIFGASEYAKDGLMPITEWLGPSPWLDRYRSLIDDIWKHADVETPWGKIPSTNLEVGGELLQTCSRLYWLTRKDRYRQWASRLADYHFLQAPLLEQQTLRLRDHGCEILAGLSEVYLLVAQTDPDRRSQYRPLLHDILDRILEIGINDHGMMPNAVSPKEGKVVDANLSDGWGYVYNAYLTVAEIDGVERYRQAVTHALESIHHYPNHAWEGRSGADGFADSIEGAINLLNRIPVSSAVSWVHQEIENIYAKQGQDGILEGWYGDGNSTRTVLMYALMNTSGVTASPWRDDLRLGAASGDDGVFELHLHVDRPWRGRLRFDRARHTDLLHMPRDYPRINQFPEWFTLDLRKTYGVTILTGNALEEERPYRGLDLQKATWSLRADEWLRLKIRELGHGETVPWRTREYAPASVSRARAWQDELRKDLRHLLKAEDFFSKDFALKTQEISRETDNGFTRVEVEFQSTPTRRIRAWVGLPEGQEGPYPGVVAIHGHGGNRQVVYDEQSIYRGFASRLARQGYVTIAVDVGQHHVFESGRTLMGERLGDLVRCVDYLLARGDVDPERIGTAGLSLGGEMAMWLGALDERLAATVSSGFLTTMDQMERNHCMCWKLPGLRALVDYADIYALTAPRALMCQNGEREGPRDFSVPLAREAMRDIERVYRDYGALNRVSLDIHSEGHVISWEGLNEFLGRFLLEQKEKGSHEG